jgi:Zn-dependent protease
MPNQGAFLLFRLAGIEVFLHWSWFVVAMYEIQGRVGDYRSPVWNVVEYLALFLIVTLHEFGHALACRQVGGTADRIMLWPLGGVAYVSPPARPGATLWSIAAGPLVNVALAPVLIGAVLLVRALGVGASFPDAVALLRAVTFMNLAILAFNVLPIYPLDGGQILRALLWFVLGRARSLMAATIVGFLGVLGLVALAVTTSSAWLGIVAAFAALSCWRGFQQARMLSSLADQPRHQGFACVSCGAAPPVGAFWACDKCRARFDTFETYATCPGCHAQFATTMCVDCGRTHPIGEWATRIATQQ